MILKKLDGRMSGYGDFTHCADFTFGGTDRRTFAEARRWCEEQWGQSVDYDIWQKYDDFKNPAWAWERGETNNSYRCRIYLASEKEAQWFGLRWGGI